MSVRTDLIFDLGVYDGADSAYYLHKGYRVVGVEANPLLMPHLRDRFAAQIAAGRYTLLNIAISATDGEAQFWICDDNPALSSQYRSNASHAGRRHHQVSVEARRFRSILKEFGTPLYAKIDIEGSDHLCLEDISEPPSFISLELGSQGTGEEIVSRLQDLGYARFKIISQLSFQQPTLALAWLKAKLHPSIGTWLTAKGPRVEGDWHFPSDASGPFGEATRGEWLCAADARKLARLLLQNPANCDWYDPRGACSRANLSRSPSETHAVMNDPSNPPAPSRRDRLTC